MIDVTTIEGPAVRARAHSLEAVLAEFSNDPAFRARWFSKADLLGMLSKVLDGDPLAAFERIRSAAKGSGLVGSVPVRCEGERRGTRYAFGAAEHESSRAAATSPTPRAPRVASGGLRDFPVPARPMMAGSINVHQGDNLEVTRQFPAESFDLIYIDPPFNTGRAQSRTRIKTERDEDGDRVGFQGRRYRTTIVGSSSYSDSFDNYMVFLVPRLEEAYRLLKPTGSFFLHLDYREVHYAKVALDQIFGRESFINEIIWAYDYGARATNRWSPKHDNILWYAKNPKHYCFNYDEIDRIPYMAPSLVGEEKAARGKTPTDAWWHTIVSPNGKEKTGYPTQKPLGVLTRIVRVHSRPGDSLLDFFAGSGSFGEAAASFGRNATLVDESAEAITVMRRRFANYTTTFIDADGMSGVQARTADATRASVDVNAIVEPEDSTSKGAQPRTGSAPSPTGSTVQPTTSKRSKQEETTQGSLF
jgi:site-specific DNA-methyltransferase (adenine-specific)